MTPPCAASRTDQGGHPSHNEDRALVGPAWWAVADGMGGHHGGEVASATAVAAVDAVLTERLAGEPRPAEVVAQALAESVAAAAATLRERGELDADLSAMGTTLVAAALAAGDGDHPGAQLVVANVGDSRAYLLDDGGLRPLTRDDNVAQEMHALGLITAEQVSEHPGQYQLTKALTAYDVEAPVATITRSPARGRLLLCSDGLTGELSDVTLAGLLGRGGVDEAADALVRAAVRAPARDNVTVVVVDPLGAGDAYGPGDAGGAGDVRP